MYKDRFPMTLINPINKSQINHGIILLNNSIKIRHLSLKVPRVIHLVVVAPLALPLVVAPLQEVVQTIIVVVKNYAILTTNLTIIKITIKITIKIPQIPKIKKIQEIQETDTGILGRNTEIVEKNIEIREINNEIVEIKEIKEIIEIKKINIRIIRGNRKKDIDILFQ